MEKSWTKLKTIEINKRFFVLWSVWNGLDPNPYRINWSSSRRQTYTDPPGSNHKTGICGGFSTGTCWGRAVAWCPEARPEWQGSDPPWRKPRGSDWGPGCPSPLCWRTPLQIRTTLTIHQSQWIGSEKIYFGSGSDFTGNSGSEFTIILDQIPDPGQNWPFWR